jgi:hypothetical protein
MVSEKIIRSSRKTQHSVPLNSFNAISIRRWNVLGPLHTPNAILRNLKDPNGVVKDFLSRSASATFTFYELSPTP